MGTWAAMFVVYNEEEYIEYSISSVLDRMDHVIVLRGVTPWHGPALELDRTSERVTSLGSPKITLIEGSWDSEADQRNEALSIARDLGCDFGLIIDADEVYAENDLDVLIETAEADPGAEAWVVRWWTYWKSPLWRIVPPEPFQPVVAVRIGDGMRFEALRTTSARVLGEPGGTRPLLHHFSYAKPSERILDKLRSFEHAGEIPEDWWESKWLAWDADHMLTNLHPTVPECYRRARYFGPEELPSAMRAHPYVTQGINGLQVRV